MAISENSAKGIRTPPTLEAGAPSGTCSESRSPILIRTCPDERAGTGSSMLGAGTRKRWKSEAGRGSGRELHPALSWRYLSYVLACCRQGLPHSESRSSKLTDAQLLAIISENRQLRSLKVTPRALAQMSGVGETFTAPGFCHCPFRPSTRCSELLRPELLSSGLGLLLFASTLASCVRVKKEKPALPSKGQERAFSRVGSQLGPAIYTAY
jgi:hypothetical protein